ncbi:MAG: cobalamin-dependent protein [Desulfocapsaceae bacterium]|nr:cobalamin-dependent protein [Desulfocapsaceae bacterium]
MEVTLSSIIEDATKIPLVPLASVAEYRQKTEEMTSLVDAELASRPDIMELLGYNALQVMYENHKHHALFMATVLGVGGYELLARTVPWVYRSYHSHGFSYDYFPIELEAWQKAISRCLDKELGREISAVYSWMIDAHDKMIKLAEMPGDDLPVSEQWFEIKEDFRNRLLEGDFQGCLAIANHYVIDQQTLQALYLQIIQPAMYEIGMLWEEAKISVAQEHLASAVVARIMATIGSTVSVSEKTKGKAIVTSAVNEFHEIGAWMISDVLYHDGWQVRYLGANTPGTDLLTMVDDFYPDLLAISVTMPFSITAVKNVIASIKENVLHKDLKVMVGGRVFNDNPELLEFVGAHGFAANTDEALRLTRNWQRP